MTFLDCMEALDKLHHAQTYLGAQFNVTMTRPQALAHFDARAILRRAQKTLLEESELIFLGMPAPGCYLGMEASRC